jgi:hypothetical protein
LYWSVNICNVWYLLWRSSPQLVKYLKIFTWNMPSVSLDTHFYTVSLEKFGESVNRRRIDNTIKEQTMIYKPLHRKLKIEQHELLKTVGLRCSRKVSSSYCIAACEILRFPSEIYRQYTYIVDKYIICFYEL